MSELIVFKNDLLLNRNRLARGENSYDSVFRVNPTKQNRLNPNKLGILSQTSDIFAKISFNAQKHNDPLQFTETKQAPTSKITKRSTKTKKKARIIPKFIKTQLHAPFPKISPTGSKTLQFSDKLYVSLNDISKKTSFPSVNNLEKRVKIRDYYAYRQKFKFPRLF